MIEINLFDFACVVWFTLVLGSFVLMTFSVFSKNLGKSWYWGKQSLIALAVLYFMVSFLQMHLRRYCAIQESLAWYIIKYILPVSVILAIGWYFGQAKKAQANQAIDKMKMFLLFTYIYAFGLIMIPSVNLMMGIKSYVGR